MLGTLLLLSSISPFSMRFTTAFVAVLATVSFVAPATAEASYYQSASGRDWRYSHERPSHRTIESGARNYRSSLATHRRAFQRRLQRIEKARDEQRAEQYRSDAPGYGVDRQGFVPYHTIRYRRSVRHFHWNSLFQQTPDADVGQGPGDQDEQAEESGR